MINQNNKNYSENILYVIALPIGNNKDITLRAIEILENVDFIYCEDTRNFQKYKNKYSIKAQIFSYHDYNENSMSLKIIELLNNKNNGIKIGLVSDAGTPMISDPGYHLIRKCHENNIKVVPIPGVCSVICALSVCPFNSSNFTFLGFFEKNKVNFIEKASNTVVFFEAPHRIISTLKILKENFSIYEIFIAREMTKCFETFYFSKILEIDMEKIEAIGEFVIIINKSIKNELYEEIFDKNINWKEIVEKYKNINTKDLSSIIEYFTKIPKKQIYQNLIQYKNEKNKN